MNDVKIVRVPLRISLAGGGTDFLEYANEYGGFFIAGAINKYITIVSGQDIYNTHPNSSYIQSLPASKGIAIYSDMSYGSGLGSSGALCVGLIRSIDSTVSNESAAYRAYLYESKTLKRPVGIQDQYIAALGGIQQVTITESNAQGKPLSTHLRRNLHKYLLLFDTGIRRDASIVLKEQKKMTKKTVNALHKIKALAYKANEIFVGDNWDKYGDLLNEHWQYKKTISKHISLPIIDNAYSIAIENGARGGKLVGAGGGGYLLFYTRDSEKLIAAMDKLGMKHIPYEFVEKGVEVLYNGQNLSVSSK